jgi:hypothetical protein
MLCGEAREKLEKEYKLTKKKGEKNIGILAKRLTFKHNEY